MEEAVKLRLMSDVPPGAVFLAADWISSANHGLCRPAQSRSGQGPLRLGSPTANFMTRCPVANLVAQKIPHGASHSFRPMKAAFESMTKVVRHFDEPFWQSNRDPGICDHQAHA